MKIAFDLVFLVYYFRTSTHSTVPRPSISSRSVAPPPHSQLGVDRRGTTSSASPQQRARPPGGVQSEGRLHQEHHHQVSQRRWAPPKASQPHFQCTRGAPPAPAPRRSPRRASRRYSPPRLWPPPPTLWLPVTRATTPSGRGSDQPRFYFILYNRTECWYIFEPWAIPHTLPSPRPRTLSCVLRIPDPSGVSVCAVASQSQAECFLFVSR